MTREELDSYKKELKNLMQNEKLYLNPKLTSNDLAGHLDISTKSLSQVINQGFSQNFFDYVDTDRCEEVKRLLKSPDKGLTILEVLYQAGFN